MWIAPLVISLFVLRFASPSDVRLPPTIKTGPVKDDNYRPGHSFTLKCTANGVPEVQYEWKMNGVDLNLNRPKVKLVSDGTITISEAGALDAGFYQCIAKNQYGTALSNTSWMQMGVLDSRGSPQVAQKVVTEGDPFCVEAVPARSVPKAKPDWQMAVNLVDPSPSAITLSRRMQIAENGDLCFTYAKQEDDLRGRIYKLNEFNERLDRAVGGSYTRVTVTRVADGPKQFPPVLSFSSPNQTIAVEGQNVTLSCFFSGNPEPRLAWNWPKNALRSNSYVTTNENTRLTLKNVHPSDEGNYTCFADNDKGVARHTMQIRVEAVPKFNNMWDGPNNVNITEGESVTFNCNPVAIPEASIVWFQNGEPIDTDDPPKRFVFSNNNKSLTIRDACRDCIDRERKTDLMVIQCNASNVHGYAVAQGYLNVLIKTEVKIMDPTLVFVDFLEKKHFVFQCLATSDPSTPAIVRWNKTEPYNDLVRDEPPYIFVRKEFLIIIVYPNCSSACSKYLGEYKCDGNNGYSSDHAAITISYRHRATPDPVPQKEESWAVWKIIVGAGTISLVLFLIGMFLGCRSNQRSGTVNLRAQDRRLPNLPSMYERVDYDSIGIPLEAIGGRNGSMPRACSMYDRIGYASIDQVLNDMANGYDSIDANHGEANGSGRPLEDDAARYDDMGYSIPQAEGQNRLEADHNQLHDVNFELNQSGNFLESNHQFGSNDIYSDLSRKDVNPYLYLGNSNQSPAEINPYLDLGNSNQSPTESNPYLELGNSNQSPMESNRFLEQENSNQSPTEVNPYLDLEIYNENSREVNPYLNLDISENSFREVDPEMDSTPKEVNHYLDLVARYDNPHLDTDNKEVSPYMDMSRNVLDPCYDMGLKKANL